jgi:iron complex outermembrane receptor protein
MSILSHATRRQQTLLLCSVALFPVICAHTASAQTSTELPAVTVTQSRLLDRTIPSDVSEPPRVVRRATPTRQAPVAVATPGPAPEGATPTLTTPNVGIVGASNTVITAEQIASSPALSLQEIIGQVPGVQLRSTYGGVNGAGTTVDLRGFGAAATANTLVLINGRRLNDIDLSGVDFSTIPRDSIARIEITKGNSGAVLYGDNAVGGVINIVTKTGAGTGKPFALRAEGGVGSFNQRQEAISFLTNHGPWSTSFFGNAVQTDGYRANNALNQRNAAGEIRYSTPDLSAFINLSADDQRLRLPGTRLVDPSIGVNELLTDRRGTSTPLNFADQQGASATAGFTRRCSTASS